MPEISRLNLKFHQRRRNFAKKLQKCFGICHKKSCHNLCGYIDIQNRPKLLLFWHVLRLFGESSKPAAVVVDRVISFHKSIGT